MFKKKKMIITLNRDGTVVTKEIFTRIHSALGILKKLKRQARYGDPNARILTLEGVITLVIHTPHLDLVTVHPADPLVKNNTLKIEK